METKDYTKMSLDDKVRFYNERIAPNNERYFNFPYIERICESRLAQMLYEYGVIRFARIMALSDDQNSIDWEEDKYMVLDEDNGVLYGYGPDNEDEFDSIYENTIKEEMENGRV